MFLKQLLKNATRLIFSIPIIIIGIIFEGNSFRGVIEFIKSIYFPILLVIILFIITYYEVVKAKHDLKNEMNLQKQKYLVYYDKVNVIVDKEMFQNGEIFVTKNKIYIHYTWKKNNGKSDFDILLVNKIIAIEVENNCYIFECVSKYKDKLNIKIITVSDIKRLAKALNGYILEGVPNYNDLIL